VSRAKPHSRKRELDETLGAQLGGYALSGGSSGCCAARGAGGSFLQDVRTDRGRVAVANRVRMAEPAGRQLVILCAGQKGDVTAGSRVKSCCLGRSCGDPGMRRSTSWWQRLALDGSLLATGTQGDVLAGEREQQLGQARSRASEAGDRGTSCSSWSSLASSEGRWRRRAEGAGAFEFTVDVARGH